MSTVIAGKRYLVGRDSAFGPPLAVAKDAKAAGVDWWEVYGGPNAYHAWTQAEVDVLHEVGLAPLFIWVPTFGMTENPEQAAADAVGRMEELGIYGAVSLDTEEAMIAAAGDRLRPWVDTFVSNVPSPSVYLGAKYLPSSTSPIWVWWGSSVLPGPGAGSRAAVQYGPATDWGFSVDRDLATPDFPLSTWDERPKPKPPTLPTPGKPATPPEEEMAPIPVVVVATTAVQQGEAPHIDRVGKESVWIVWEGGRRSWLASGDDVDAWLARLGQDKPIPLNGDSIIRLERCTPA